MSPIEEWYEEVPTTRKVLKRRCAADDCDEVFEPLRSTRVFHSDACRKAHFKAKCGEKSMGEDELTPVATP